jgi:AcrR family transcriptional regulator
MGVIEGARERARREITAAIMDQARRQLAAEGAARLSLRAVARELGMVSSAVYRYFPSRDELLTALIVEAYDALGQAVEDAAGGAAAREAGDAARFVAAGRAMRAWAVTHPHEYALVHGTPVPGYAAPQATTGPGTRVPLALLAVVRDAHAAGRLGEPSGGPLPARARRDAAALAAEFAPELPPEAMAATVAAWAQLVGLVGMEVFGQFTGVVAAEAREEFLTHAAHRLAAGLGLS